MLGLSACDSALDKTPLDKVDLNDYFTNATDLELYSNRFYLDNLDATCWNNQEDQRPSRNISDFLKCGTARTTPASGGGWSFTALRKMNTLLDLADKNCSDKAAVKHYTAVARFFRAYFYFEKVKRFGDVPWIDTQLGSDDQRLYNPRDSREYIMTKMLEDIDYAINNLSLQKGPYYVTPAAALALKSNFCLFEGTYRKYHELDLTAGGVSASGEAYEGHSYEYYLDQCVDACEKLMGGTYGKYKLYSTNKPDQDYRDLFAAQNANTDEYILAVMYNIEPQKMHNSNSFMLVETQAGPQFTRKFVASYLMKDGTRFTDKPGWQTMTFDQETKDRDPRMAQTMRCPGYKRIAGTDVLAPNLGVSYTGYQPVKFVTQSNFGTHDSDRTGRSVNDMPVFRYAEVLLNYAEAKAELGKLTQTDLDKSINLIRKRAGMPNMNVGNTPDPYLIEGDGGYFNTDKAGAQLGDILEIRRERCIELAMEHRRQFDLMRWKSGMSISQPLYGMYIPGPCSLDMSGNGKPDYVFYAEGTAKPTVGKGCVAMEIGKDIKLSEGTKGYIDMHSAQVQGTWNEERDYLFPIPTGEMELNKALKQNPGWQDIKRD